eukprot:3195538-Pyramimonas_sp.AAC.1
MSCRRLLPPWLGRPAKPARPAHSGAQKSRQPPPRADPNGSAMQGSEPSLRGHLGARSFSHV